MKYLITLFVLFSFTNSFAQGSGNTLNFNGTNNAVLLGDQVATNVRTIEAWVKLDNPVDNTLANGYCIIGRSGNNLLSTDQFHLGFETNAISPGNGGKISFSRRVGMNNFVIYSDQDTWPANTWIHVAAVLDATDGMKMYINGVEQTETDASTEAILAAPTPGDDATIGKWGVLDVRFFDGDIDEVRLWDDARTENEIRSNLCAKLLGTVPGLKAYYNLDNVTGTNVPDESTNTFDGTLSNFGAAPSILSGAPLGDQSEFVYAVNLNGSTLNLVNAAGDAFTVSNIATNSSVGAHIYRVNAGPSSTQNLNNPLGNYYGVWLTGLDGTFDIDYDHAAFGCTSCFTLSERNDNAVMAWTGLNGAPNNCTFSFTGESTVGNEFRAEFIINQSSIPFDLGNDTAVCVAPLQIGVDIPNASYEWQDNSTGAFFNVLQSGTYYVDVDVQGCLLTDTIEVELFDLSFELGNDTSYCDNTGNLQLTTGLNNNFNHEWQDGSTSNIFTVSNSGEYYVTVSATGCSNSDTIEVLVLESPELELGQTVLACQGEEVVLMNQQSSPNTNYVWSTQEVQASIVVDQEGVYSLVAQNNCGLEADSVAVLFENCDCNIYIPNAFTPDGDAANDVFKVIGDCRFMTYELSIYNRVGTQIFFTNDINDFWDGTFNGYPVKEGVYSYKIKYTTESIYSEYIHGHINVLR